ncbi:hypothetical protein SLEP1_g15307 [Rubroshorea leprosula]|uniref:Uncharacterized protein n=1 Tax=Rubroshorea leprosula TaxID=152421 RepID=A0AAV5IYN1_9ROSI|nr:hypothetical protein SLEP1_g15307 [Rubroshorea leprosula]
MNGTTVTDVVLEEVVFKNTGKPVSSLFPPGKVKAAANIIVITRAPTTEQDSAAFSSILRLLLANSCVL